MRIRARLRLYFLKTKLAWQAILGLAKRNLIVSSLGLVLAVLSIAIALYEFGINRSESQETAESLAELQVALSSQSILQEEAVRLLLVYARQNNIDENALGGIASKAIDPDADVQLQEEVRTLKSALDRYLSLREDAGLIEGSTQIVAGRTALEVGDLNEAELLFRQAATEFDSNVVTQLELQAETARRESASAYALLAQTISIDPERFSEAVTNYITAAEIIGPVDRELSLEYEVAAYSLELDQAQHANNTQLAEQTLNRYLALIEEVEGQMPPHLQYNVYNTIGQLYWEIGRVSGSQENLELAIEWYERFLNAAGPHTPDLERAQITSNIASAAATLAIWRNDLLSLEQAITFFERAADDTLREPYPDRWASFQSNLGTALYYYGGIQDDAGLVALSVETFREAAEIRNRNVDPLEWAETLNNLGGALSTLGELEERAEPIFEAISVFQLAAEERTRERVPLSWAGLQSNIGSAYSALGRLLENTTYLELALDYFDRAQEVEQFDIYPQAWARTQALRTEALHALAISSEDLQMAQLASQSNRDALQAFERLDMDFFLQKSQHRQEEISRLIERLSEQQNGD